MALDEAGIFADDGDRLGFQSGLLRGIGRVHGLIERGVEPVVEAGQGAAELVDLRGQRREVGLAGQKFAQLGLQGGKGGAGLGAGRAPVEPRLAERHAERAEAAFDLARGVGRPRGARRRLDGRLGGGRGGRWAGDRAIG